MGKPAIPRCRRRLQDRAGLGKELSAGRDRRYPADGRHRIGDAGSRPADRYYASRNDVGHAAFVPGDRIAQTGEVQRPRFWRPLVSLGESCPPRAWAKREVRAPRHYKNIADPGACRKPQAVRYCRSSR